VVRIPIIPGYTDTEENLERIGAYVVGINPEIPIELVNFNPLARDKYVVLGRDYPLKRIDSVVSAGRMQQLRQIVAATGAVVRLESE
jgi:pyruvate formate lyase activating enzyme